MSVGSCNRSPGRTPDGETASRPVSGFYERGALVFHQHNAHAERVAEMEMLRDELAE